MRCLTAALAVLFLVTGAASAQCKICSDKHEVDCFTCDGEGTVPKPCARCEGEGHYQCTDCSDRRRADRAGRIRCRFCFGTKARKSCKACNGRGWSRCPVCVGGKARCGCKGTLLKAPCPECATAGKLRCPACNVPKDECGNCSGGRSHDCRACGEKKSAYHCTHCHGRGFSACHTCSASGAVPCRKCRGEGKVTVRKRNKSVKEKCKPCRGKGEVDCERCERGKVSCEHCEKKRREGCVACQGRPLRCTSCDPCPARYSAVMARAALDFEDYDGARTHLETAMKQLDRAIALIEGKSEAGTAWERKLAEQLGPEDKRKKKKTDGFLRRYRGQKAALRRDLKDIEDWATPRPTPEVEPAPEDTSEEKPRAEKKTGASSG